MALGRLAKRELPGKRESGPKARPINDQPGADSRHSRGYSLQPSDVAWHLRSAGEENERKKEREGEGKNALLVNRAASRARIRARALVRAYVWPKIVISRDITRRRDAVASNVFYPRRGHKSRRV